MPLPNPFSNRLAAPVPIAPPERADGPDATPHCADCGWRATLDHVMLFRYRFCPRCERDFQDIQGDGRYVCEGLLDDGPDTRLFLATDPRLERIVSLLYYKPAAEGAPQLAVPPDLRAKHEALTLAKIVHPGVARIHLIEEEQCRPALVVESLLGTLARPIASGLTAELPAAAGLLYRMAEALRAAADSGQCHHRLLPDRVGLSYQHEPKLMGFGHQRPADFMPGLRSVEAAFLAPEVRVLSPDADERADVFSVGVMTYAVLAGCYPMVPRRRGSVPPVTKFRPDVPAGFSGLLNDMIAHDPAARPASHAELLDRLQGLGAAVPLHAAA